MLKDRIPNPGHLVDFCPVIINNYDHRIRDYINMVVKVTITIRQIVYKKRGYLNRNN